MVVEVIQPPPTRRLRGVCPFRLSPPLLHPPFPRLPPPSGTHSTGEGGRGAYPRDHRPFITNYMSRGGTAAQRGCKPSISRAGRASCEPAPASPGGGPRPRGQGGGGSRDLSRPPCQTPSPRRRWASGASPVASPSHGLRRALPPLSRRAGASTAPPARRRPVRRSESSRPRAKKAPVPASPGGGPRPRGRCRDGSRSLSPPTCQTQRV